MKRIGFAGVVAAGVALSWAVVAQQNPMRPGNWEVTVKMNIANAPVDLPASTETQCVTQEQIDDPTRLLAGPQGQADSCMVSDFTIDGNTISWAMTCTSPVTLSGTARMVFASPESYTGTMTLTTPQGEMTMNMTGKHLGACE